MQFTKFDGKMNTLFFALKINESVAESWSVKKRAKIAEKVQKPALGVNVINFEINGFKPTTGDKKYNIQIHFF